MKTLQNVQILILWLFSLVAMPMMAQSDEAKEINRIKLSKDYLYAEATMLNEAEALSGAQAILEMTVADWMSNQNKDGDVNAYIINAKQHFTPIKTMRGQYHRAFLYVKKSDIISVTLDSGTMVIAAKNTETATPQDGDAQPVTSEIPTISSVEELKTAITLTPEEQQLATITKFSEVEGYITNLEQAGRVSGYGKKKTMPAEGVCHLLVYNREGSIVAALRREADGKLMNLKTHAEDNVKNYPDCGAIWLQFK